MTFNDAKEYLKSLLSIDSVEKAPKEGMPFGEGVYECLEKALAILKQEGFRVKNGGGYYGYGEIGEGELFGILTHLDVVPAGKDWTKPPFGATEGNGRIYGRGALDDKSPFIACLYAVKRLLEEGRRPKKRIRFILGCDEESGWKCMEAYEKNEEMPSLGISPDGDFPVINCEKGIVYHSLRYPKPTNIDYIVSGERANMVPDYAEAKILLSKQGKEIAQNADCEIKEDGECTIIKTKGVSAHGSHPENGVNALISLMKILSPENEICREIYEKLSAFNGENIGLNISDEKSGRLTLNVGTAKTDNESIIFEIDVRHPVSYKKEFITEKLKTHLTGEVKETFFHLPLYVEKTHPLVKTLLKAYNIVTGENAEPISIGGGTYARVLPLGVAFGPCFPDSEAGIHCADEYVDLKEFETASEIYYEALKELCFE